MRFQPRLFSIWVEQKENVVMPTSREQFVERSLRLLSLERAEELDESRSNQDGSSVKSLAVTSQRVGLHGRHILIFESAHKSRRKSTSGNLPANVLTNGDIVGVWCGGKPVADGDAVSGVIIGSSSSQISVVFDDLPDSLDLSDHNNQLQLVKLANDVTYRRIKRALEGLQSYDSGRCCHLISALFSDSPLLPPDPVYTTLLEGDMDSIQWHTPSLNTNQQKAILSCLSRPDVSIIHGPPGTGKTTTLVELILQATDKNMKVLACAPSNIAVDNMVEKLSHSNAKVIRLGHPARVEQTVLKYSLDAWVANSDSASIVLDVRHDIEKAYSECRKTRSISSRKKWRSEIKTLKKELREREEKCLKQILSGADVILCTLTGASPEGVLRYLPEDHFSMVVIDECAQALEASCWIALTRAPRCVLAGDHCQLPPTILSQQASEGGLSQSLMERVIEEIGRDIVSHLTTQYRMNSTIMTWPSQALYDGSLLADKSVDGHLLSDLNGVREGKETTVALVLIDTAGCSVQELETEDGGSKGNEGEADLVFHHIKKLRSHGVSDRDMAVIAPYSFQVELIRERIQTLGPLLSSDALEVHTVDGFQGREKEAIIISLTRSNDRGEYGFLKEKRRSNVAITRARRHLCIVGDSETVSHEPFMKGMIESCHEIGDVWSAHEYMQDPEFETFNFYKKKATTTKKPVEEMKEKKTSSSGTSRTKPKHDLRQPNLPTSKSTSENPKKELTSLEEDQRRDFQRTLQEFVENRDTLITFPISLSGNERRIVHELCEELGLLHVSKGQGKERFIEVSKDQKESSKEEKKGSKEEKKGNKEEKGLRLGEITSAIEIPEELHPEEIIIESVQCETCGKDIPPANFDLHQIECSKSHRKPVRKYQYDTKPSKSGSATHTSKKSSKHKQVKVKTTVDDLDSLLAEVTLSDSKCKFPQCSKNVNMLGVLCRFCKNRFCMEHNLAEVHGCGDAGKQQSWQDLQQEARHRGSVSGVRRSMLKTKLSKQLEEKSTARQSKTVHKKDKKH